MGQPGVGDRAATGETDLYSLRFTIDAPSIASIAAIAAVSTSASPARTIAGGAANPEAMIVAVITDLAHPMLSLPP